MFDWANALLTTSLIVALLSSTATIVTFINAGPRPLFWVCLSAALGSAFLTGGLS